MNSNLAKPSLLFTLVLVFSSRLLFAQAPPGAVQESKAEAMGISVPIEIREQFLGKSGSRTVVKFTLSTPKEELRRAGADRPRTYTFFVSGDVKDASNTSVDTFRIPVGADLSEAESGKRFQVSFLRSLPPGNLEVSLRLETVNGKTAGLRAVSLQVPAMQSEFLASDAGTDTAGLPSAAAVVLEAENREPLPRDETLIRILAPSREVPVGLIRVEAEVKPPIERVEFYLDEKRILVRNKPPYTVELDLGTIPKKQTLKAVGFDRRGNLIDADAWAINERDAKLAVRIVELDRKSDAQNVSVKVAVQSIAGGVATNVKLFADNDLLNEWTAPPFTARIPRAKLQRATLLRATALDANGKEFSDFKFLKGDDRFMSKVEVNLVELNVSVLDGDGRFAKGLEKSDFEVLEDGSSQSLGSFEFSGSLPISLGMVIDGSGSMKDSMQTVREAASGFITRLIGEKDQGFVIEFREVPTLLAGMTKSRTELQRAINETRAGGATALYDSLVMGLYQFRAIQGRKALVVLTDGKDNHSWTEYETLRRYIRTAGIPVYFIGLDLSILDVLLKSRLKDLAADTGGATYFIGKASELENVYKTIETELRSQYFMSYLTESKKAEDHYRTIEVKLKKPGLRAKTIRGYFP